MPNDKDDGNGRQKSPVTSTAKKDNDVKKTSTRKSNFFCDFIQHFCPHDKFDFIVFIVNLKLAKD